MLYCPYNFKHTFLTSDPLAVSCYFNVSKLVSDVLLFYSVIHCTLNRNHKVSCRYDVQLVILCSRFICSCSKDTHMQGFL